MTLDIQVLAWNRHKTVAELKRLMGSQPIHIFIFVFVDWLTCKILITNLTSRCTIEIYRHKTFVLHITMDLLVKKTN
jgi:hypothetical protein